MSLYTIATNGQLEPHLRQEWLITNGLGAFASGTVVGCNTRCYHGLLCAASLPPVGRLMMLNRIGEVLVDVAHPEHPCDFSINQFVGRFFPRGDQYLRQFQLDGIVRFDYEIDGTHVAKEVQLFWMRNVAAVRYVIRPPAGKTVELRLSPFVSLRDFHSILRADGVQMQVHGSGHGAVVQRDQTTLHLQSDAADFVEQPQWWNGHVYAMETDRGLPDHEDLFTPGQFVFQADRESQVMLWASLEPVESIDFDAQRQRRREALGTALSGVGLERPGIAPQPPVRYTDEPSMAIRRLLHAAADFVVDRRSPDGSIGKTILAGYPWFADWGRDTMIALPGLLLCTGRFDDAKGVLTLFAHYVSEGMIPNRFDDYTNEPSYNTVDASLWFIHAVHEYLRYTNDTKTYEDQLRHACRQIIDGYQRGTRFHIKMDPADGLITQGDATTQLTWMDAKQGDRVFTPRQGKPVEINALWHHALKLMGDDDLAGRVAESFRKAFWISPFRGLADVVRDGHRDTSLRPNQIFAASLSNSPLTLDQQRAVVEVVRRELLTPVGLRSLAISDPGYIGRYSGPPVQRDAAYHNGTIWGWLIGPFLEAWLRTNGHSSQAVEQGRRWLEPLLDRMHKLTIAQISECFEGDEPHRPVGCPAQAWSVAEVLRMALELGL
jgi:predicted glycogen debranching enzyme